MPGPGPDELIVEVRTSAGSLEEIVVASTEVEHGTIEVGYPIHQRDQEALIELPRESVSGSWRLWVPRTAISEDSR
jgi:hypothetical protein